LLQRPQSALPASFRPVIALGGRETRVLVEQTTVVDPQRLGRSAGRLDAGELRAWTRRWV
jgi:mRNA interferase MazF